MYNRTISKQIKSLLKKFPIVTLTGVRQCGKSTLLMDLYKDYSYVSLEDPDIREFAISDPRGFLSNYDTPCIIDEAQRAPEIFSYIQTKVDQSGKMGQYILSGSHNMALMQSISQSLAGRTGVLKLAPFSIGEMAKQGLLPDSVEDLMLKGFYPAIYDRDIDGSTYHSNYMQTYIERDVRLIKNIPDSSVFIKFVKLCASRSGQVLNYTDLSKDCGISVPTVREWLSVLMISYILFELPPYYNNYSKRLVKSPKLYFYDTGLLCYLLGIESSKQLTTHPNKGAIFETMIISDYIKSRYFMGKEPNAYYWRDTNQNEVDLITEETGNQCVYEIKSSSTMDQSFLKGLKRYSAVSGIDLSQTACIYCGEKTMMGGRGSFIKYTDLWDR